MAWNPPYTHPISTCVSSIGFTTPGESAGSLAQAFRAAGAETVVATLWPVSDEAAMCTFNTDKRALQSIVQEGN